MWTDPKDDNFKATGRQLWYRDGHGEVQRSILYRPTPDALAWHGFPIGARDVFAKGTSRGTFTFIRLKVTGRSFQVVPNSLRTRGVICQITYNLDGDPADVTTGGGWIAKEPHEELGTLLAVLL